MMRICRTPIQSIDSAVESLEESPIGQQKGAHPNTQRFSGEDRGPTVQYQCGKWSHYFVEFAIKRLTILCFSSFKEL